MKLFLSYYNGEQSDAEDIRDYLLRAFAREKVEVFMASNLDSIAPGEAWEPKLIEAVEKAEALVVLMSVDALSRPWLNFEIGVAWAKKVRIVLACHKGLSPDGLPRPYSSLQAINLNGLRSEERLDKIARAVATSLGVSLPKEAPVDLASTTAESGSSFSSKYRTWSLRPAAHIGEVAKGSFLVGVVMPARGDRARAAGVRAGGALYVRLFLGETPEGFFVPAMVDDENAGYFERVRRDTVRVEANLRLAAAFEEDDRTVPLVVLDSYRELGSSERNKR